MKIKKYCGACFLFFGLTLGAVSEPWLDPGDSGIRSDIQILADAGVISVPVTTWPITWASISDDVLTYDRSSISSKVVANSLARVRAELRDQMRVNEATVNWGLAGASNPTTLRTFEATPRNGGEAWGQFQWMGEATAIRLKGQAVSNPYDGQNGRADGSYLAFIWKNQIIALSTQDRWWGPGWEGSLILSNNARPIPAITLQRNKSDPFQTKWLSWIGPWTYQFIYGQMEHNRGVPLARFLGFRIDFRPIDSVEIGLSRTAQWCGTGRSCSFSTFLDVVTVSGENTGQGGLDPNEPGNQLAAFDVRWTPFRNRRPIAVYIQGTAEDEAGGLPSRWIGLGGVEVWGSSEFHLLPGTYRLHFEYANTVLGFYKKNPFFDGAYNSSIYTSGYRYKDRSVGHSMDSDGEMMSLGLIVDQGSENYWDFLLRRVRLNTGGNASNPVSAGDDSLWNVEINRSWPLPIGQIKAGIGYDLYDSGSRLSDEGRVFLEWRTDR